MKQKEDLIISSLEEFYSPILILIEISQRLRELYVKENIYEEDGVIDMNQWKNWISNIFMPINIRIYKIIKNKSHLIIETEIPQCIIEFCAHVEIYKIIVAGWETNRTLQFSPAIPYPTSIVDYFRHSCRELKNQLEGIQRSASNSPD